ncbi:MAG: hypothetical protein ACTHMG_05395 [Sphingomonas sp.]
MKRLLLAAAALALLADTAASAAAPCVTPPEATSITLVAMPEIIRQVGQICATQLPPSALVRQTSGAFIAKYQAEADRAWPDARTALARVAGPDVAPLLQSDFTRPMLTSLLAPALVGTVDPGDCGKIEHIATDLQPLPARNTAQLIVATLQLVREKKAEFGTGAGNETLDIPICRDNRR